MSIESAALAPLKTMLLGLGGILVSILGWLGVTVFKRIDRLEKEKVDHKTFNGANEQIRKEIQRVVDAAADTNKRADERGMSIHREISDLKNILITQKLDD